jgi:phosphatidate cytidylyltransferase
LPVRILTAAALLAAFIAALLFLDRALFAAVVALILALGGHEWGRLCGLAASPAAAYGVLCAALFAPLALTGNAALFQAILAVSALFWVVLVPYWLLRGARPARGALLATGVMVLVPAGLVTAVLAPQQVLALLGLVWVADTAALLAGRTFGRHKLAPAISPGKTWEGVVGALLASLAYAIILAQLDARLGMRVHSDFWMPYLGGAALLCAVSVVGDLLESALKRQAGAKDSGALLPGHGGVLDRIDSATAALPLGALLLHASGLA